MSCSASSVERGKEALRQVGASQDLVEHAPASVLELVGRADSEPKRLDRARSLLRTRRTRQRRLTLQERWQRLGTPEGDISDLDLFSDR